MDLVNRQFHADAQDRPWGAGITYGRSFAGWVYVAFVLDVFSRRNIGLQASTRLYTDLALAMPSRWASRRAHTRERTDGTGPPLRRGVQCRALRSTERLGDADAVASVGSMGDSSDNAMAEALNSLFNAELVRNRGPWRDIAYLEVEIAG